MMRICSLRTGYLTVLLALPLVAASCASADFKLVQKATSYATYYQDHYVTVCTEKVGPPTCLPCRTAINDAAREVPLANKVQKIGKMPKQEVEVLKDIVARLEQCP